MLPYVEWTTMVLGPVSVESWGFFVALGIVAGAWASAGEARRRGLDGGMIYDLVGWVMLAALVGARAFHVLLYEPAFYLANPLEAFKFWHGGLSMFGGFFAAGVAGFWFFRIRRVDVWRRRWPEILN
jgi:phosphatidylglycerol:prolipoprotein diacylglycerol transferase